MVLDDGGDDDVVGLQAEPIGEVVDGLGGVAADDGHVVGLGPTGEPQRRGAGLLVGGGSELRLPAGAAVHARVPRQELLHPSCDCGQRGSGRGGVERDVATIDTIDARDGHVVADEAGDTVAGHVKMIWPPAAMS